MLLRQGSTGSPVSKVQFQLNAVGGSQYPPLAVDGMFGPLTDRRVREFQLAPPNVLAADGIVGPLTQGKLDAAFLALIGDNSYGGDTMFANFAGGGGGGSGGGQAGTQTIGLAVVTEPRKDALDWAKQVTNFWGSMLNVHTHLIQMAAVETVQSAAQKIEQAAKLAGRNGFIFLSVGHGIPVLAPGRDDEGMFELAPSGFKVVGNNAFQELTSGRAQVSAFYDFKPSPMHKSDKESDGEKAKKGNAGAQKRLANFNRYIQMGQTLKSAHLAGLVLVTCRIGKSKAMMRRVRQQMGVPLMAYGRRVAISNVRKGFERFFLEGDQPGQGTNIPFGEIFVPSVGRKKNDVFTFK